MEPKSYGNQMTSPGVMSDLQGMCQEYQELADQHEELQQENQKLKNELQELKKVPTSLTQPFLPDHHIAPSPVKCSYFGLVGPQSPPSGKPWKGSLETIPKALSMVVIAPGEEESKEEKVKSASQISQQAEPYKMLPTVSPSIPSYNVPGQQIVLPPMYCESLKYLQFAKNQGGNLAFNAFSQFSNPYNAPGVAEAFEAAGTPGGHSMNYYNSTTAVMTFSTPYLTSTAAMEMTAISPNSSDPLASLKGHSAQGNPPTSTAAKGTSSPKDYMPHQIASEMLQPDVTSLSMPRPYELGNK